MFAHPSIYPAHKAQVPLSYLFNKTGISQHHIIYDPNNSLNLKHKSHGCYTFSYPYSTHSKLSEGVLVIRGVEYKGVIRWKSEKKKRVWFDSALVKFLVRFLLAF